MTRVDALIEDYIAGRTYDSNRLARAHHGDILLVHLRTTPGTVPRRMAWRALEHLIADPLKACEAILI
jgi:hypothetical protein